MEKYFKKRIYKMFKLYKFLLSNMSKVITVSLIGKPKLIYEWLKSRDGGFSQTDYVVKKLMEDFESEYEESVNPSCGEQVSDSH